MSALKRSSRADRRRRAIARDVDERRKETRTEILVYSQVAKAEILVVVKDPITSEAAASAKNILSRHMARSSAPQVLLDLSECAYVDTPGLSVLFEIKRQLTDEGRYLTLLNPSRMVMRMLNITRMARVFPVRMTTTDHDLIATTRSPNSPSEAPAVKEKPSALTMEPLLNVADNPSDPPAAKLSGDLPA